MGAALKRFVVAGISRLQFSRFYTILQLISPLVHQAELQHSSACGHSVCPKTTTFAVVALLSLLEQEEQPFLYLLRRPDARLRPGREGFF